MNILQFIAVVSLARVGLMGIGFAYTATMVITGHALWTVPGLILVLTAATPIKVPDELSPKEDKGS